MVREVTLYKTSKWYCHLLIPAFIKAWNRITSVITKLVTSKIKLEKVCLYFMPLFFYMLIDYSSA